ncbi:MAG: hypothetical protein M3Z26_02560 [Bacteroidota bacterium]|nr:hypothetical protein [Bacteroidota bacterium]
MLTIFQDYNAIKDNITKIISLSGYKNEYVAKKIGLTPQNFAIKKLRKNWSVDEIKKIVEVITEPNEDAMDALMLEIMRSRKAEETVPLSELKKEFGWK